jgi:AcrR family transcriptional regulator
MVVRNSTARRERARVRARRDILLAAAGVFARSGFAAATLADLAQAAGYAPPSLYRYFESKEEIYRSLVELLREDLAATFAEPVDRSRPLAARLEGLFLSQVRLAASRADLFTLLVSRPDADAPATKDVPGLGEYGAGVSFYERQLAAWLRRNAGRRELRCPVEDAARVIAGVARAFHHRPPTDGRELAALARLVADLVLNGISATASRAGPDAARGVTR